jgi:hypothetical protein
MPRVAWIEHQKAEIKLPVHFSAKRNLFTCTYSNIEYEDVTLDTLRTQVLAAIDASLALEWIPVVIVEISPKQTDEVVSIFLSKARKYIGYHESFGYKVANWDTEPETRLDRSTHFYWSGAFTVPTSTSNTTFGKQTFYFPYSQEVWERLENIQKYLRVAAIHVQRQFGRGVEGITTLEMACQSLFDHMMTGSSEATLDD